MTNGPAERLSPGAQRRVLRAALLRPWPLLVLAIGTVFFATTLTWWAVPLTLATYAALVFLAVRDPVFQTLVLEGREEARAVARSRLQRAAGLSPEGRARRLRPGETRTKLEAALEARRRVLLAIEESGDPSHGPLTDSIPELQRTADLLVDLAEARERATGESSPRSQAAVDAELSDAHEKLRSFRAEVVRASIDDAEGARDRAGRLRKSIQETNRRLQELRSSF